MTRSALESLLVGCSESAGYMVETAVDGEEGCRKAMVQPYQLIISDLEMPKLNGYEVIQALVQDPRRTVFRFWS